jgi:hypothetical protein
LDDQTSPTPPQIAYQFIVENTGLTDLVNVMVLDSLVDVQGGPISLSPGQTDSTSFTAIKVLTAQDLEGGGFTNSAIVTAFTLDGRIVTDSDTEIVIFPEPVVAPAPAPVPDTHWAPGALPDLVVQAVQLSPSPSIVGGRFEVSVLVRNDGEAPGVPDNVAVWVNLDNWDNHPALVPTAEQTDLTPLLPGETRTYNLGEFRAAAAADTYHVMARVNREGTTLEPSFMNNFGGATYTLEPVIVTVTAGSGGEMIVEWNSTPGYYYFVERADSLLQPFVDIAANLPATAPVNVFVDENPAVGPAFYRVWGYKP